MIARPGPLCAGMSSTECRESRVQPKQRTSLTEVSCASYNPENDCIDFVEKVPGMRCLGMCCSRTAERNPQSWAEEWSLKAVRYSRTAEREVAGIATSRSACTVYLRHQS